MSKKIIRKETVSSHWAYKEPQGQKGLLVGRESKGQKGLLICQGCGNIYFDKEWFSKDNFLKHHALQGEIRYTNCPACKSTKSNSPTGIIKLSGNFLLVHKKEIINLIKSVERRLCKNNPLDRIIDVKENNGQAIITTTSKELAIAIGKDIKRAFKGDLKIKWTKDEDLVRIGWER